MRFTRSHTTLILINAAYLIPLTIAFMVRGDWEFVAYISQVIILVALLLATLHRTHFPTWLLAMLSLWAALHMAGGAVQIGDGNLYWYEIVHVFGEGDSYVLRFDQLLHFYGFFTATFVAYWLMIPQLGKAWRPGLVAFIAMLAGMGFGAINEIIEFGTVLVVPDNGVGGYYNTAIDLVANGLGSLTAALVIAYGNVGRAFHTRSLASRHA